MRALDFLETDGLRGFDSRKGALASGDVFGGRADVWIESALAPESECGNLVAVFKGASRLDVGFDGDDWVRLVWFVFAFTLGTVRLVERPRAQTHAHASLV